MKIVASFGELVRRASVLSRAKLAGNKEEIEKAKKAHDEYKEICLMADELTIGFTHGNLSELFKGNK